MWVPLAMEAPSATKNTKSSWGRYFFTLIGCALYIAFLMSGAFGGGNFALLSVGLFLAFIFTMWAVQGLCIAMAAKMMPATSTPFVKKLIRWLLAIVVIGCGAAIGYKARFHNEIVAQVSQGAWSAYDLQAKIDDYYARHQAYPADNQQAGIPEPEKITNTYVIRVVVTNGTVVATFGNRANARIAGRKFALSPHHEGNETQWSCDSAAGTTVDVEYLPICCKSVAETKLTPQQYQSVCPSIKAK